VLIALDLLITQTGRPAAIIHLMTEIDSAQRELLLEAAGKMTGRAYAPYSRFRVGAALLAESGQVYRGCNVENLSYGITCCAERAAIATAVAAEGPAMRVRAIAVASDPAIPCSPCGACRQAILELGPDALVLYQGVDGRVARPITDLLPDAFSSVE
jgi:cytidine deaminase